MNYLAALAVLLVIWLASLSEGIGTQGPILFANRVSRRAFVLNLLATASFSTLASLAWVVAIWFSARVFFATTPAPTIALVAVGFASLPRLLGVLQLAPVVGPPIAHLLEALSSLIALVVIAVGYDFTFWQALLSMAGGWLLVQGVRWAVQRRVAAIQRWIWSATTGLETKLKAGAIPAIIVGYGAAEPVPGGGHHAPDA